MDSRDKRSSAVFPNLSFARIYPNPDDDLANAADRTHMAWLYRALTVSASAGSGGRFRTLMGVGL